ncbi:MAG: 3-dehydroquinate synthase [Phycisphaerae bacterium]
MTSVTIPAPGKSYDAIIGLGARARLPELIQQLSPCRPPVLLTDQVVGQLHADKLRATLPNRHHYLAVPSGETSKSLATAANLYDQLAALRVERGDLLLALGGGVVTDLGGFVAATWHRGMRFVTLPTTLEAAIDAAVGGKTGLNHAAGKNLIGVFHHPSAVLIDTEFLATLPARDHTAGLAESVKHAMIADAAFFDWHEQHAAALAAREPALLDELIARNLAIKAAVVAADEREAGPRMFLNFGHTIGHALEQLLHYALRHGECVALGMLAENELMRARGWLAGDVATRMRSLLETLGLPVRLPAPVAAADVLRWCRADKKVLRGALRMAVVRAIGQPECVADFADHEVEAALGVIMPSATA